MRKVDIFQWQTTYRQKDSFRFEDEESRIYGNIAVFEQYEGKSKLIDAKHPINRFMNTDFSSLNTLKMAIFLFATDHFVKLGFL